MGDYSGSTEVGAPAGQLFGYLSDIRNLPRYFTAMTSAEPAGQDAVRVAADLNGTTREGEAWFRAGRGAPAPGVGIGGTGRLSRLPRRHR